MPKTIREKEFYYTNEEMVKDLLSITPISGSVLDAGSGDKVWFNNLVGEKYECEIERGCDFYGWEKRVDWVVGNPPFRHNGENQIWRWIDKASQIANKGMGFLLNHKVFNTLTPVRLELLAKRGFYIQCIRIVADKRWFGRYYYLIFGQKDNNFISWKK
jgi:hypothetical protein